ncbi:MAG: hypothetical protein ACODAA_05135 [Gemmatimonadota bacterium]
MRIWTTAAFATGCALLALPQAATAQGTRTADLDTPTPAVADSPAEQRAMYELPTLAIVAGSEVGSLSDRARSHYEHGEWTEAARLYQQAAEAMPPKDPNSYPAFDMAARLFFYGDEFSRAREMMERAAGVATATGDIVTAAYRHVDAAFIAVWEGYPGSRREHVRQAESFASRSDFGGEHAARIHALINGVTALPGDDGEQAGGR